mmetsp:Transcript_82159/g.238219  ORF Transcript_82159/g.238219 Transcript_82159/m.238219 type:complete len:226 (+) Transcript_82159:1504-2181(+)
MESLPRNLQPLAPRRRHVQYLRGSLCAVSIALLATSVANIFGSRPGGLLIKHDVLEIARVVQVELYLRGVAHLHVDPQIPVVPDQIDLEVWAAFDVVDAPGRRLHVHVLLHFSRTLAHKHPTMNSPVLVLVLIARRIVFGVRLHLLLVYASLVNRLCDALRLLVFGLERRLLWNEVVFLIRLGLLPLLLLAPLELWACAPGFVPRRDEAGREAADAIGVVADTDE